MHSARAHRLGVIAVLAFTGPLATAAMLACTADTTSTAPPSTPPPATITWQPFQGIELPITEAGPDRIDGPVASGFDRSPAGAALAAIHATVRMSVATDTQWTLVGQRMLASGAGRDRWATVRAQISITAPIEQGAPKILGYRVSHHSPDVVDVDIYSVHPDDSLTRNSTRVLWQGEDWRLHLSEDPTSAPVAAITALPADAVALTPR
ncbi:Uncharacterised protein [Nocardia farcinica]|uniref:hypothetical protein n=1 Tax=Nocardia farcinica TaxID=37329 RepID=UPI000DFA3947|nr:hypothetical protein [Nocardia farcinica]SUE28920.1 Uncharacterised protein [Nocardia farcinica]